MCRRHPSPTQVPLFSAVPDPLGSGRIIGRTQSMNQIDLNGRVAVVTGGAQGIGRAVVERFVASGARVEIWDVDGTLAAEAAREIGAAASGRGVDVTDAAAVAE